MKWFIINHHRNEMEWFMMLNRFDWNIAAGWWPFIYTIKGDAFGEWVSPPTCEKRTAERNTAVAPATCCCWLLLVNQHQPATSDNQQWPARWYKYVPTVKAINKWFDTSSPSIALLVQSVKDGSGDKTHENHPNLSQAPGTSKKVDMTSWNHYVHGVIFYTYDSGNTIGPLDWNDATCSMNGSGPPKHQPTTHLGDADQPNIRRESSWFHSASLSHSFPGWFCPFLRFAWPRDDISAGWWRCHGWPSQRYRAMAAAMKVAKYGRCSYHGHLLVGNQSMAGDG